MNQAFHIWPKSITFGFHTAEDIKNVSVLQVVDYKPFNELTSQPNAGGVYDPLMGPMDNMGECCASCQLSYEYCSGHYGHIELSLPVFHPLFQQELVKILKLSCPACKTFLLPDETKAVLAGQLELLSCGLLVEAQSIRSMDKSLDDSPEDDPECEAYLKSKKGTFVDRNLIANVEAKVKEFKEAAGISADFKPRISSRNTEAARLALVKEFAQKSRRMKKCPKCKGGWKKIVFYESRLVFSLNESVASAVGSTTISPALDPTVINSEENSGAKPKKAKKRVNYKEAVNYDFNAKDAMEHMRQLWHKDKVLFGYLYPGLKAIECDHPTDVFFIKVIPVVPPKFRPVAREKKGLIRQNARSEALNKILQQSTICHAIAKYGDNAKSADHSAARTFIASAYGKTQLEKLQSAWQMLQKEVACFVGTQVNNNSTAGNFKKHMEKKDGLFRRNMMGKRVDYAARSVITSDPNIAVDEVGIPEVFAKKLTFPTPVSDHNYQELARLVRNGPDVHPGANSIVVNGRVTKLSRDPAQRESVASTLISPEISYVMNPSGNWGRGDGLNRPKIVNRHMISGDIVLLNRQPTLHKPSIMAHKARVLPGEKTLRLHYANCKAYNADFDGDEMNVHFPQDLVSHSEAHNIVGVPYQYLVPKDGTPLSGLIQDHVIAGVRLSMRGRFFNRADYQQLVFAGLGHQSRQTILLPATILKPKMLWSGKQVISTIVLNLTPKGKAFINMESTCKISSADWQTCQARPWIAGGSPLPNPIAMTEIQVVFRREELLCGVLDKMHCGATSYGLVHLFYELYGGQYSCQLLTCLARLFTAYLQLHGFTLGVSDILVTKEADNQRRRIIEKASSIGDATAARGVGMEVVDGVPIDMVELRRRLAEVHLSGNELKRKTIDREYKSETDKITNSVNQACIAGGLLKKFPDNNLSLMIQSGAKGSPVNAMQISCLLGQIELEGKRPPLMISGRSLPSFPAYDTSPRAGGFIAGRFMTGIRPQEFFFHCMAGREGLIDTAVKTSKSGYQQRCMVKNLEGVKVNYDQTVRDSDGCVLQFLYGEDGLDVCKSQYLNEKGLSFLTQNHECINTNVQSELLSASIAETRNEVEAATESVSEWIKRGGSWNEKRRIGVPLNDSKENPLKRPIQFDHLTDEDKVVYKKARQHAPDPVLSKFSAAWNPDVISEHMQSIIDKYDDIVMPNSASEKKMSKEDFFKLVSSKLVQAACEPGEAVGILAAQSIGEPSTQMTLNTFHFAGRGEMNVTLGIPRLREILMTASDKMKTPSMDIPMLKKGEEGLRLAHKLKKKLARVTLSDVLEDIDVTERMLVGSGDNRARIYDLNFKFLPQPCYQDRFCIKPVQILRYFEDVFVSKILLPGMRSEMETQSLQSLFVSVKAPRIRITKKMQEAAEELAKQAEATTAVQDEDSESDEDSDADLNDDADASAAKRSKRKKSGQEYDGEDEEQENGEDDEQQSEDESKSKRRKISELDGGVETDDERPASRQELKDQEDQVEIRLEEAKDESVEIRKNKVIDINRDWIIDYQFDHKNNQNCLLTLKVPLDCKKVDMSTSLLRWTAAAVVSQVPKIKRAFVTAPKTKDGDVFIQTDGVNIEAMFRYANVLDLKRLYSNDIHAMSRVYGIEAASRVIINEIRNVFKVYGITVDPRHLSLVASYMTSGGGYKSFSRHAMLDSTSPFQQISFETAVEGLKNAVLQGKTDNLQSPSARIIVGLPGMEGTGSFDLVMDPKIYAEQ